MEYPAPLADDQEDPGNAGDRGQWVKCLPPALSVIAQARTDGMNLYPQLRELYRALRKLHRKRATHLYVDVGLTEDGDSDSEMLDTLSDALLGVGEFTDNAKQMFFLGNIVNQVRPSLSLPPTHSLSLTHGDTGH